MKVSPPPFHDLNHFVPPGTIIYCDASVLLHFPSDSSNGSGSILGRGRRGSPEIKPIVSSASCESPIQSGSKNYNQQINQHPISLATRSSSAFNLPYISLYIESLFENESLFRKKEKRLNWKSTFTRFLPLWIRICVSLSYNQIFLILETLSTFSQFLFPKNISYRESSINATFTTLISSKNKNCAHKISLISFQKIIDVSRNISLQQKTFSPSTQFA